MKIMEREVSAAATEVPAAVWTAVREALPEGLPNGGRVRLTLPDGCGREALGVALAQERGGPCVVLAPDEAACAGWLATLSEAGVPCGLAAPGGWRVLSPTDRPPEEEVMRGLRDHGGGTVILDTPTVPAGDAPPTLAERVVEAAGDACVLTLASASTDALTTETLARLNALCGEMTLRVEAFDLVAKGILRPHRDLLYLCEPDGEALAARRAAVEQHLAAIRRLPFFADLPARLGALRRDHLYRHRTDYAAITALLQAGGGGRRLRRLARRLFPGGQVPALTPTLAEAALTALLAGRALLEEEEKQALTDALVTEGLVAEGRISLDATSPAASAAAKREAIRAILAAETEAQGAELRLLICSSVEEEGLDVQSIFASIADMGIPVGAVEGDTLALPHVRRRYGSPADGSPDALWSAAARLLGEGEVHALVCPAFAVGTVARSATTLLLTDATSAARLLRGEALRADLPSADLPSADQLSADLPTADRPMSAHPLHIWHLATAALDPVPGQAAPNAAQHLTGWPEPADLRALGAVLDGLVGPLDGGGLGRPCAAPLPTDRVGVAAFNQAMLRRTRERHRTVGLWRSATMRPLRAVPEVRIPRAAVPRPLTARGWVGLTLSLFGAAATGWLLPLAAVLTYQVRVAPPVFAVMAAVLVADVTGLVLCLLHLSDRLPLLLRHRTRAASVRSLSRALLATLQAVGAVGEEVRLVLHESDVDEQKGSMPGFLARLAGATEAEADTFRRALAELLSPMGDPRYLLVRTSFFGRPNWRLSFAVPAVLGQSDASVRAFVRRMRRSLGGLRGGVRAIYTRRAYGARCMGLAKSRGGVRGTCVLCRRIAPIRREKEVPSDARHSDY